MAGHADFIYRLVDLVEYAEAHDLQVASLALNAAVEVIAPSMARPQRVNEAFAHDGRGIAPVSLAAPLPPRPRRFGHLQVIQGGLSAAML